MNRKLHNSLMALVASCGLLAVGLMAASPTTPAPYAPAGAALVQLDADADATTAARDALAERPSAPKRNLRRGRPSVAMPFFSFAPRG